MTMRETLAMALFAKWSIDATGFPDRDWQEPDWSAYTAGHPLNPVGLSQLDFLQEADWLLRLIEPHASGEKVRE